jgi:hypothetical protein
MGSQRANPSDIFSVPVLKAGGIKDHLFALYDRESSAARKGIVV